MSRNTRSQEKGPTSEIRDLSLVSSLSVAQLKTLQEEVVHEKTKQLTLEVQMLKEEVKILRESNINLIEKLTKKCDNKEVAFRYLDMTTSSVETVVNRDEDDVIEKPSDNQIPKNINDKQKRKGVQSLHKHKNNHNTSS